ncbi:hypothetical protein [Paracandidimonas soli]|uniref:Uncharacterized protein n=1 Tax=Paracandidimonas soli TaxID=1917182 RepID=A0A4R3VD42_9BURK|nr:hypothetical protein [Paracandidimonas soli]TCV01592.1 hypothetical protein EV686_102305 [Paracandidimonas soli]
MLSGPTRFLDTSALPAARMREFPLSPGQIGQWLADMESLLQARQAFVLVYERLPGPGQQGDPEGFKKTVLWLKAHRDAFGMYCKGMILMCEDTSGLAVLQARLGPLEKVYRVPARVACSADEVQKCVHQLAAA